MVSGLSLVLVIGAADVATGPLLTLWGFYLLPVSLVTWHRGRGLGVLVALASTATWFATDLIGGPFRLDSPALYLNTSIRFLGLFLMVAVLAALKDQLQRQRELTAEEGEAAQDLRALNDVKDTLLHAVAHDLRGPITAILGSVQTLERGEHLQLTPEQRAGLLNAISASGRKLNRMVTDLLDLDRLDRGLIEPECESTDLGALARRVVDEADFLSDHPCRVVADPVVLPVDAGKVERILENLLINAAKHTPVGTPVLVKVRARKDGVLLSVEDEGPGIPEGMKTVIFEPFRQGSAARASGSGAGIGLSLVTRFAALHGGRAWVEDRPGVGTCFFVFLPGVVAPAIPRQPSEAWPTVRISASS